MEQRLLDDLNSPCSLESVARLCLSALFNFKPLFSCTDTIFLESLEFFAVKELFFRTHCHCWIGLCITLGMSKSEGLFFSALQPHTAVSTYAVPNDRELTADRQAKEKRVQQQVQQRLAEKASSGEARGTAKPARDNSV